MNALAERLRRGLAASARPGDAPFLQYERLDPALLARAAVLIPIIDAPEPRVLLTVRHAALRAHGGQVAFPGGRIDPTDEGPVAAALREAWEEVGLAIDRVDIVGCGRPYGTGSGYLITPVVGVIPEGLDLRPHEAEVDTLFEVPLDLLLSEAHHIRKTNRASGVEYPYYEIDWPDQRIWGVTAGLIVDLAPRLRDAIGYPA